MKSINAICALLMIAALVLSPSTANATLLAPDFLDAVVALGNEFPVFQPDGNLSIANGKVVTSWQTVGTGFFYGEFDRKDEKSGLSNYHIYLVTAKHVVAGYETQRAQAEAIAVIPKLQIGGMRVRINPTESGLKSTEFDLEKELGTLQWHFHPNGADIAVIPINVQLLKDRGYEFNAFSSDVTAAPIKKLKDDGVGAGDGVFLLGFPMQLAGKQRNYVIARQGIVSRISEMLDGASQTFLIDAFAFPGNSGGPVVLKPDLTSVDKTPQHMQSYLIGMVLSEIMYVDTAQSVQTHRARISFEENSGLAEILPVDYIEQTITDLAASASKPQ